MSAADRSREPATSRRAARSHDLDPESTAGREVSPYEAELAASSRSRVDDATDTGSRYLPATGSLALFDDPDAAVVPSARRIARPLAPRTSTTGSRAPGEPGEATRRSRREAGAGASSTTEQPGRTTRGRREAPAASSTTRRGRGAPAPDAAPTAATTRRDARATTAGSPAPAAGRAARRSTVGRTIRTTPSGGLRIGAVRRSRLRVKLAGAVAAATLLAGGAVVVATTSNAEAPATRQGFSPGLVGSWVNDKTLDETRHADQYAQATVSGLLDGRHNAGFLLRYGGRSQWVLAAVSGAGWIVQGAGSDARQGTFDHSSNGVFRAEISDRTVKLMWNGDLVTTQTVDGDYSGKSIVPTVWQASQTVTMTDLVSSSLERPSNPTRSLGGSTTTTTTSESSSAPVTPSSTTTSADPSPSPATSPSSTTKKAGDALRPRGLTGWFSGASGDSMGSGGFDGWRSTKATIAGTWDDSQSAQAEVYSICGGQYKDWNQALDLAMGGIYGGDSWSAAASGAYDDRWSQVLTKMKSCWGGRDPNKLFVRFAHEFNLSGSDWKVRPGEEGDFAKAFTRLSNLRYKIFPGMKLVFCPNDGTSGGLGDPRKAWPGRDPQGRLTADVYCVDSYNMYPHVTTTAEFQKKINATTDDGAPLGIEKHRQYAAKLGVPFAIGEWSNNGNPGDADGGGESPQYMRDFYAWAAAHGGDTNNPKPGQLLYEVQFNLWTQYQLWPNTMQPETAAVYKSLPWGKM